MKQTFKVKGMHCKSCEMLVKESVREISGVNDVDVSLTKNTVTVDYDEKKLKDAAIRKAIESEGYKVGE